VLNSPKKVVMEIENPSKLFADGARPDTAIDRVSQLREDWRLARTAHIDLQLMRMPRVNLLLKGPETVTENVLDLLLPTLSTPIENWRPGARLALSTSPRLRTLILRDVSGLGADDQQRLLKWLEHAPGRTQVVSTTASSMLPRVEAGKFMDTLYYRLNTIFVNLSA
jgi:hypothetical protein